MDHVLQVNPSGSDSDDLCDSLFAPGLHSHPMHTHPPSPHPFPLPSLPTILFRLASQPRSPVLQHKELIAAQEPRPAAQGAPPAGVSLPSTLFPTCLSLPLPYPHPTPSLPQHPNVFSSAAVYTLATATPPAPPASAIHHPSPISHSLRQQILSGNYVDLAQLIQPSFFDSSQPRELQTVLGPVPLKQSLPARSKDLTPVEFALAFSLFCDVICSAFPYRRSELDNYLSIVLDMALRFGGAGFYTNHVHFAAQAAGQLQQQNQGTYLGVLDSEIYCRIFAARSSLFCDLCGAPSHPASACTIMAPPPHSCPTTPRNAPIFDRLSSAAPLPPVIPRAKDTRPTVNVPVSKGVDNPIGVATRKYSGKKRLIIDLSSLHGSDIPSINSLIPSPDFSMQYATIDHAMALIRLAGHGAWLSKADITSAFKVLPIHPDFWCYFGVCWKGAYYFSVRLTFGCKSSPKIFDSLSEALCWILSNNYRLPYVLHLLDDFLVVTPSSSPPRHSLTTLTSAFSDLGVPLSEEKTSGPGTSIEFLGITLDSLSFQASLPLEKVQRISLLLSNYLLTDRCTKRQLLALLGHLNYAIRIIPQAKSFLSQLLTNGISFFYDDFITHPADIQLYTDAAPSVGFGGYYGGRWFAAAWPSEFESLDVESRSPSSALYELYPVIIATLIWGHEWSKKCITIHSDNTAVVDIINKGRSHSPAIMPFTRRLTLISAQHQFNLRASHIPGHHNAIADSLSRFSFQKFRCLAPDSDVHPTPIPPFSATIFD
ncbi:uncharacterized protein LOC126391655 [Epinephelus moara]|uniref:uncharacterized protein LOC126391655 n=1 Tax=Epinephelus moara TaxID=300413 RepID=UPI00214EF959|nr:uncharacterized protein LOC126391655 [Epinephelus moara]